MIASADSRKTSAQPGPATSAPVGSRTRAVRDIRRLLWLYLILLIFEGALRKWVVPQYSSALLIVRDPVALAIYLVALRGRLFPSNGFTLSLIAIAILSWIAGMIVLSPYLPASRVLLITGFGVRSNFLHLPLIFIFPAVFDLDDVKRIGRWTIIGMIPMALLMALQFRASPEAFINRAAGLGEGMQIGAGGDKIRPPGVFSFISGAVYYLSAVAAFLLHAVLAKLPYKTWLLATSSAALLLGMGVSGSRSTVLAVGVVFASLAVILVIRPRMVGKVGRYILLGGALLWLISYLPIFREGLGILSDRFVETAEATDTTITNGLVARILGDFTGAVKLLRVTPLPLGGFGLGVGTNGGANLLTGHASFLLAESEWSRILLESGPILGVAFLLWRCAITYQVGRFALIELRNENPLPLFLFSVAFLVLLEGPFGQPTSLGFAVVLAGLTLAARTKPDTRSTPQLSVKAALPLRRRSAYAERLHDSKPF